MVGRQHIGACALQLLLGYFGVNVLAGGGECFGQCDAAYGLALRGCLCLHGTEQAACVEQGQCECGFVGDPHRRGL